ncbi:metal-dependent transcriptional regulator [Agrococcus sediminis]|uniref:Manganese transport regulator n=1 Tax=Agrococcus sediminis TaxID=2599924 RepID=A0A5M8QE32_9MICO|nr:MULTISPECIES: metal-dependent transcriptional regulator [Agrococcus]RWR25830.1 metal-dependent transcriptional regulator [Agrococcus lahaulensis]KAA6432996.1 metal-dependent transcriptional regulator [Agrococcus sediminis]MDR7234282.1 DtxR family Mn-dependent transcriptional regulator [Agrococcus sp. BE272]UOW00841.1 metal-dependent transcriptional regulator [Agrococcus sp. SCSIO52902]UOW00913.1 metal-dependent transcriptional regulator [Agrococcus sp. SCSIO52902]
MQSTAAEDYVKAIYHHTEWQPEPITPSQLASRLGLANSTVTEMVKKLAAAGLVRHRPYGAVELTDDGRALAVRQVRRHRVVETWLVERHGYDWDEVHDEAEILEHALSDRLLDSIARSLGDPERDPHGDPIPAADGTVRRPDAVLLADAEVGHAGAVVRISDADPAMLRFLAGAGVALDARLTVLGQKPYSGSIQVRSGSTTIDVGPDVAQAIWLAA